jgi:hypothetical protein
MRKLLFTLLLSAAIALGVASLATARSPARCGTLYTPRCVAPTLTISAPVRLACYPTSKTVPLGTITVNSIAGVKKVTITVDGKVVKTQTYSGRGPQHVTFSGLHVSTTGLKPGVHTVTITTVDNRGKKATHVERFSVCSPPKFTG